MRELAERFRSEIISRLDSLFEGQEDALLEAATIFADTIRRGGIIRAFGSGHSFASALEICGRAGGYIQTRLLREPSEGIYEMLDGVGDQLWLHTDLRPEDCLVVISNSGRNPLPVELAIHARAAGIRVVAVTALSVSRDETSRSKSGLRLFEVADVVLDNKSTFGDAALKVEGLPTKVGGTSTYTGCMLLDCAIMTSFELLLEDGLEPPLYLSANIDGGPQHNQALLDRYRDRLAEY